MSLDPMIWAPNWGAGVRERMEWRTAIIEAWDGSEHRHLLRALPRIGYEYEVVASGDQRRALMASTVALASAELESLDLPLWCDITTLTQASAAGTSILYGDTAHRNFAAGFRALLVDGTARATVAIAAVLDDARLQVSGTLAATWPAGTRVYPLRTARLVSALEQTSLAPDVGTWRVLFTVDDIDDAWPQAEGPDTYWALPVWARRPNWRVPVRWRTERPLKLVDGEAGPRAWYGAGTAPGLQVTHQYTALGRSDCGALRRAIYARAGRSVGCWMPSYQRDIRLVANAADGAIFLTVAAAGWVGVAGDWEHRHLQIVEWDGTIRYVEVSKTTAPSATTERLWLQLPLTSALAVADVRRISWMYWARQATDQVELLYAAPDVVEAEITWTRPRLRLRTETLPDYVPGSVDPDVQEDWVLELRPDPPGPTQDALAQTAPAVPSGALDYQMPGSYDPGAESLAQTAPPAPTGGLAELLIGASHDHGAESLAQTAPPAPTGTLT